MEVQNKCIIILNLKLALQEKNNQQLLILVQIHSLFHAMTANRAIVAITKIPDSQQDHLIVSISKFNVPTKFSTETEEYVSLLNDMQKDLHCMVS